MDWYNVNWDKIFWIVFILIGIVSIFTSLTGILSPDLLVGLVIIVIGVEKLAIDFIYVKVKENQKRLNEGVYNVSRGIEQTYELTSRSKDRSEFRILQLDRKRIESEKRMEDRYRELAKKIIELENKLNDISKLLFKKSKRIKF